MTFSEPVTGVGAGDFALTTTGTISGASITGVTGSLGTYTVTVNTGSGANRIALGAEKCLRSCSWSLSDRR